MVLGCLVCLSLGHTDGLELGVRPWDGEGEGKEGT